MSRVEKIREGMKDENIAFSGYDLYIEDIKYLLTVIDKLKKKER